MSVLVFGRSGQVARELAAASDDVTCLGRAEADLDVPGTAEAAIRQARPRAVINAAAWTDVDGAEASEDAAYRLNAKAPGEIARACNVLGVPLVHISTDYVFDGAGETPFAPDDPTAPLGAYGRTKLAGEQAVRAGGAAYVILRTSWVFSAHGTNFPKTMLRVGATRDRLRVVEDQIGGPTPASAIASACLTIAHALTNGAPSGIHHFAGAPDTSWAGFARAIFEAANMNVEVEGIPAADWPTPAARPANSRLDCTTLRETFGIERPDWRSGLPALVRRLTD
ncbi:dTDP-4-dehydrorhamnose reductase [Jannaschia seosinensis]|uniref:dTDP-4-dehydrorhamnose reductase n=1 Tax=Jannaschia seosinensis TaxID=313367 RepID=A0A0M7BGS8_9RHOB|nr:dTDP-4-dehydrorhamnose reductase [Jannaschia seosinensis]CUH40595.1 dTDP-4-dehydrorhamnose reductase [Jannaschia seosinensis]